MRRSSFVAAFLFVFATAQAGVADAAQHYRVCLDPGHGGPGVTDANRDTRRCAASWRRVSR